MCWWKSLEITELSAALINPWTGSTTILESKSWVFQVVSSIVDWWYSQCCLFHNIENFLKSFVLNGITKRFSLSVLNEKYNHICPIKQEFSWCKLLSFELSLEVESVIAQYLILNILIDLLDCFSTVISTFLSWCVNLFIKVSEVLDCQNNCTWSNCTYSQMREFRPEPSWQCTWIWATDSDPFLTFVNVVHVSFCDLCDKVGQIIECLFSGQIFQVLKGKRLVPERKWLSIKSVFQRQN